MKSFLLVLIIPILLFAGDIHLKNSQVYKNVKIINEANTSILIEFNGSQKGIYKSFIEKIDKIPYNENMASAIIGEAKPVNLNEISVQEKPQPVPAGIKDLNYTPKTIRKLSNAPLLALSAASFILAYDYFKDAADISESVNSIKKIPGINTTGMETQSERKTLVAVGLVIAGVINMVYALTPVEINISSEYVGINYQYNLK